MWFGQVFVQVKILFAMLHSLMISIFTVILANEMLFYERVVNRMMTLLQNSSSRGFLNFS